MPTLRQLEYLVAVADLQHFGRAADACHVSQFEQHVRAVCGWPLGSPERHCDAVMTNILGDEINRWQELAAEPRLRLHLYGKGQARQGRKMGHFNRVTPRQA